MSISLRDLTAINAMKAMIPDTNMDDLNEVNGMCEKAYIVADFMTANKSIPTRYSTREWRDKWESKRQLPKQKQEEKS